MNQHRFAGEEAGAALAYPFALAFLWRTRLGISIPFVSMAVILWTAGATAVLDPIGAAVVGLLVGIAAMGWSRLWFVPPRPA